MHSRFGSLSADYTVVMCSQNLKAACGRLADGMYTGQSNGHSYMIRYSTAASSVRLYL